MTTGTLGACVGKAVITNAAGRTFVANVFDTEEPDWFILTTPNGAEYRRRRDQITWRSSQLKERRAA